MTREESRAQTRERLIAAALEVFLHVGVEAAAIEDIAESAGYSRGAFYSNFESKEDLLCAVLEQQIERMHEEYRDVFSRDLTPAERVSAIRGFYVGKVLERKQCAFILDAQLYALRHPELRPKIAELIRTSHQGVVNLVARLTKEAQLAAPASAEVMGAMFVSMVQGLALMQLVDPEHVKPKVVQRALEVMYDRLTVADRQN